MRSPATPGIDQVLALLATIEAGSFTAAAKRLGRATSAISYVIDTLENQLGLRLLADAVTMFTIRGGRVGRIVLDTASGVLHEVDIVARRTDINVIVEMKNCQTTVVACANHCGPFERRSRR
jgi:DNA-binding transcriptional LysR family regulator